MAVAVMMKNASTSASCTTGHRGQRNVGVAPAAPRSRRQVSPQALYLSPVVRSACRNPCVYRAPRFGFGLAGGLGLLNSMLASEWLRETTSSVHPMEINTHYDRYELQADCPGMGDEDVNVEISPERVLTISGARKSTKRTRPAAAGAPKAAPEAPATPDTQAPDSATAATVSETKDVSADAADDGLHVSYRFSRSFMLPEDADVEGVSASLDKGVLTVTIPRHKAEKPQPRRISINTAAATGPGAQ